MCCLGIPENLAGYKRITLACLISFNVCCIAMYNVYIFTALHGMQTRSSDENSVRPSVHLSVRKSVTRVYCDNMVERSVQIYIPYVRPLFSLVY